MLQYILVHSHTNTKAIIIIATHNDSTKQWLSTQLHEPKQWLSTQLHEPCNTRAILKSNNVMVTHDNHNYNNNKIIITEIKTSAELKSSPGRESVFQPRLKRRDVWEYREFEQVHARRGGGQTVVFAAGHHTELWEEILEAEKRRSAAAGDKLQELLLLRLRESFNHLPELEDGFVVLCVLT